MERCHFDDADRLVPVTARLRLVQQVRLALLRVLARVLARVRDQA